MEVKNVIKLIAIFLLIYGVKGFIFDEIDDSNDKTISLINFKYSQECLRNVTIQTYINDFRTKYNEIKDLSDDDLLSFNQRNFTESILRVCEMKRNKARSITDSIHRIADACVNNEKTKKRFMLNTLLMLEYELDFVCSSNENIFTAIYKNHVSDCVHEKIGLLNKCRENSFRLLFFDKTPERVPWIQLLNGGICNFNYDAMKSCAEKPLESCRGGVDALNYILDIIKRHSVCFKRKSVLDIVENSVD